VASFYEGPVQRLIDELGRLPGIGPKSAQRITYHLLKVAPEDARRLAAAIVDVKEKISWCRRCFNIAEGEECSICRDERRDSTVLAAVGDGLRRAHELQGERMGNVTGGLDLGSLGGLLG